MPTRRCRSHMRPGLWVSGLWRRLAGVVYVPARLLRSQHVEGELVPGTRPRVGALGPARASREVKPDRLGGVGREHRPGVRCNGPVLQRHLLLLNLLLLLHDGIHGPHVRALL